MKNKIALSLLFFSIISSSVFSQVRIGGGISIDINLPFPDVVVVDNPPRRVPEPKPRRIPKKRRHRCDDYCHHNETFSYGEIQNQNGRFGRQVFSVLGAEIQPLRYNREVVHYELDSGDVLELFIVTENPDNYNYHKYSDNRRCDDGNRITKVLLNGQRLKLLDGNLSLQPRGSNNFHSVINIHSVYEGDFNGTVNF